MNNLINKYNQIVNNGNLNNIVINENFDFSTEDEIKKTELLKKLNAPESEGGLNVPSRDFNSINIVDDKSDYKIIKYLQTYQISKMTVFDCDGLPKVNNEYTIPKSIDYEKIIFYSKLPFIDSNYQPNKNPELDKSILYSRQMLIYFLVNAKKPKNLPENSLFLKAYEQIKQNKLFDPVLDADPKLIDILQKWLNPKSVGADGKSNYTPIINKGYRIIFNLVDPTKGPTPIYYDDYNSFVCIVSPSYLQNNNKKIFSYAEYCKNLNLDINNKYSSLNSNTINNDEFFNGNNNWIGFNNIPEEYLIKIDSIPYLIVGSGITPDFLYPIISQQNLIVDFSSQFLLYANESGFYRAKHSWNTAPTENLILSKYTGKNINEKLSEINELAHKYINFPLSTQIAFLATDETNIYTPSAARILFVRDLILTINTICILLVGFILVICIFVTIVLMKKFITENIKTMYIVIANGFSKFKTILSICTVALFPSLIVSILAYVISYFLQVPTIEIFKNYWMIPTDVGDFNPWFILVIFLILNLVLVSTIFIYSLKILRLPVSQGINYNYFKVNKLSLIIKKPFVKFTTILFRFRLSIAFASISKLFFLSFIVLLINLCIGFIGDTFNSFSDSIALAKDSDQSVLRLNLYTPTRVGGQYYGVSFSDLGKVITNDKNEPCFKSSYDDPKNLYEKNYINSKQNNKKNTTPLFYEWSNILYPSMSDKQDQESNINYAFNKIAMQFVLSNVFGFKINGGSQSIDISINPWVDVVSPLIPSNQYNQSKDITNNLKKQINNDLELFNGWYIDTLNNKKFELFNSTKIKNAFKPLESLMIIDPKIYSINDKNNIPYINLNEINTGFKKDFSSIDECYNQLNNNLEFKNIFVKSLNYYLTNSNLNDINISNIEINNNLGFIKINFLNPNAVKYTTYSYLYNEIFNNNNNGSIKLKSKLSNDELNYINLLLSTNRYLDNFFKIAYNTIVIEPTQEPYAYIDAKILSNIKTNYKIDQNIKIYGIQKNSNYIYLWNENNELINDLLFDKNITNPLIINSFAAKQYNLKVGDEIQIYATNNVDRYYPNLENIKSHYNKTYKIVGISSGTKDAEFYTNINAAQDNLGLYNPNNKNSSSIINGVNLDEWTYNDKNLNLKLNNGFVKNSFGGFNGIYTNENLYVLNNSLSLYSPSGLYPGIDNFEPNEVLTKILFDNLFKANKSADFLEKVRVSLYLTKTESTNLNNYVSALNRNSNSDPQTLNKKNELINKIIFAWNQKYGNVIFTSIVDTPFSMMTSIDTFNQISSTMVKIEIIVVILLLVISIVIFGIITWILINDLLRLIVLLKTLGMSDLQNSISIFSLFIPVWFLTSVVSIPILMLLLNLFKEFIFTKMGILVSCAFNWWYWLLAISIVFILFVSLIYLIKKILNKINLVNELKW